MEKGTFLSHIPTRLLIFTGAPESLARSQILKNLRRRRRRTNPNTAAMKKATSETVSVTASVVGMF